MAPPQTNERITAAHSKRRGSIEFLGFIWKNEREPFARDLIHLLRRGAHSDPSSLEPATHDAVAEVRVPASAQPDLVSLEGETL
jgi:hypothetical protein